MILGVQTPLPPRNLGRGVGGVEFLKPSLRAVTRTFGTFVINHTGVVQKSERQMSGGGCWQGQLELRFVWAAPTNQA